MATTLKYGSSGDEVKKLQETLGFTGKDVDGIYGKKTQQAVTDYQKANGLTVDGIAGNQTLGKLYASNTAPSATTTPSATTSTTSAKKPSDFTYADIEYSDVVKQANDLIQQQLANKPGEYQYGNENQYSDIINKIMNGEKFSYDLNGDALYQQYKDQYTTQGQMAMVDTMGQAVALTGGYGNSYAQTVGQQTYQGYLQQLNDKVPELYQLALNQYNQEKQDLYNQASLLAQDKAQDYDMYRDNVSDYYTELNRLTEDARYKAEDEYNKHMDKVNMDYTLFSDDIDNEWKQKEFDMALERYKVQDEQWQKEYDLAKDSASSSGGSGGSTNTNTSLQHVATMSSAEFVETLVDLKGDNEGLASFLDDCVATGRLTEAQADEYYKKYKTGKDSAIDTTVDKLTAQEQRTHGGSGGSFRVRTTR